jgi:5,10-methenyltetrahydromethanopterin hydrogenase
MTTRAPVNLVGGVGDMNSATTRALLAGHQIWRATVDEDGQYLFAVAL